MLVIFLIVSFVPISLCVNPLSLTSPVIPNPLKPSNTQQSIRQVKCQKITIPICRSIGYNYTEMPNSFNHESQEEAGLEVHQYWPLVNINCSADLKFFICSLYVPICREDYAGTIPPCRSVCERVRAGCEPVMTQYGFNWPKRMACDQFPRFDKNSVCMGEEMPGDGGEVRVGGGVVNGNRTGSEVSGGRRNLVITFAFLSTCLLVLIRALLFVVGG